MSNGAVALQLLDEPPSAPQPAEGKLDPALLRKIGEATADGVCVLAQAIHDWSADGAMTSSNREQGGEILAQLYELQRATMTDDFPRLMYACGKAVLWQRDPEIFRKLPGAGISKAPFDRGLAMMVDHLCAVLARVTEGERIHQLAMAN